MSKTIWIVAGPTASGKSALALSLAQRHNGTVVNADSMQVYREIPILGAQPDAVDFSAAPHVLYGHRSLLHNHSAAEWVSEAIPAIRAVLAQGRQPILTGGTGMYLRALLEGFSPMPAVPEAVRRHVSDLYDMLGPDGFHQALRDVDPVSADRLHPTDRQRMIRAREIFEVSGMPLSAWQEQPKANAAPDLHYRAIILLPPRDVLYAQINKRFGIMLERGALAEAKTVHLLHPDPTLPGTRALGLPSLRDYIDGRLTMDEAIEQSQAQSRQYAKRQYTWFRNQPLPCPLHVLENGKDILAAEKFLLAPALASHGNPP